MASVRRATLLGVFCVSASVLCLEGVLSRYFSISQSYHFSFLVLSLAFLGFGAGGSVLFRLPALRSRPAELTLSVSSFFFSCAILLSFLLANILPFDVRQLLWDEKGALWVLLYFLLFSLPFFFGGLTLSAALAYFHDAAHAVYAADLLGAGTGAVLSLAIFNPAGDKGALLILCACALLGAILFCPGTSPFLKTAMAVCLGGLAVLFIRPPSWLGFRVSPYKPLQLALRHPGAKILMTRWNSLSRLDVIDSPGIRFAPGLSLLYEDPVPRELGISQDGGDLAAVASRRNGESKRFLDYLPSSWPYRVIDQPCALIIEPKGGLDVLAAEAYGASSTTVIEHNPLMGEILRRDLDSWSGGLYSPRRVRLIEAPGRSALRRIREKYDLVVLSLTDVSGPAGTGLVGIHENHLLTLESFADILGRLSPDGIVSMTVYLLPPPRAELRLLATWIETLEKAGKPPAGHLIILRTWGTLSIFVKNSPWRPEEVANAESFSAERLFALDVYPGIRPGGTGPPTAHEENLYPGLIRKLLDPGERAQFYRDYLYEIRPATDNRPFFHQFFKWGRWRETYYAFGRKWLPFLEGQYLIPFLLLQATLVGALIILLPLHKAGPRTIRTHVSSARVALFFGVLGAGFMFVEVALIQDFILFLGHPLYSIMAVVFCLLASAGLGSRLSPRILGVNPLGRLRLSLGLLAVLIVLSLVLLPKIFGLFLGSRLGMRLLASAAIAGPLGFLMGLPFPFGIKLLARRDQNIVPWAWAVNAFSSVFSSILAIQVAYLGGYRLVLLLAGGLYLIAPLFVRFTRHGNETDV